MNHLRWIKENGLASNDHLQLFVHIMNHSLQPLLKEPHIYVSNIDSELDDESHKTTIEDSVGAFYNDLDDLVVFEKNGDWSNLSDSNPDNFLDESDGSKSGEENLTRLSLCK